jgi:hypothetical protein
MAMVVTSSLVAGQQRCSSVARCCYHTGAHPNGRTGSCPGYLLRTKTQCSLDHATNFAIHLLYELPSLAAYFPLKPLHTPLQVDASQLLVHQLQETIRFYSTCRWSHAEEAEASASTNICNIEIS